MPMQDQIARIVGQNYIAAAVARQMHIMPQVQSQAHMNMVANYSRRELNVQL